MRIVSWNVNGLKAATDRGAIASLRNSDADVICLSETKVMNVESYLTGFKGYQLNCANSAYPGKYGVAILSRERPVGVIRGISDKWFDKFVYQAVINKKYLSDDLKKAFEEGSKDPIQLLPWDPMGALAKNY